MFVVATVFKTTKKYSALNLNCSKIVKIVILVNYEGLLISLNNCQSLILTHFNESKFQIVQIETQKLSIFEKDCLGLEHCTNTELPI